MVGVEQVELTDFPIWILYMYWHKPKLSLKPHQIIDLISLVTQKDAFFTLYSQASLLGKKIIKYYKAIVKALVTPANWSEQAHLCPDSVRALLVLSGFYGRFFSITSLDHSSNFPLRCPFSYPIDEHVGGVGNTGPQTCLRVPVFPWPHQKNMHSQTLGFFLVWAQLFYPSIV